MKNSNFNSVLNQTYRKKIRKCCDVISGKVYQKEKELVYIDDVYVTMNENDDNINFNNKNIPAPGIEPGPPGWKPEILATRPRGMMNLYAHKHSGKTEEPTWGIHILIFEKKPHFAGSLNFTSYFKQSKSFQLHLVLPASNTTLEHICWILSSK